MSYMPEGEQESVYEVLEIPEVSIDGLKKIIEMAADKKTELNEIFGDDFNVPEGELRVRADRLRRDVELMGRVLNDVLPLGPMKTWGLVFDTQAAKKESAKPATET